MNREIKNLILAKEKDICQKCGCDLKTEEKVVKNEYLLTKWFLSVYQKGIRFAQYNGIKPTAEKIYIQDHVNSKADSFLALSKKILKLLEKEQ